ncbi:glucose-1-phosphate cytidylyltransferase [Chitinophaga oryziterrae]|uniref:Glucose-1-phosphate cytidylyltransferase n=1 Tax=Chitinophaga oryziterrae TaxID=1031224 RepID=A0A6N8JA94_9BACT|nr:glucose-1-phosphate cytidylyltransferase [Chitinophaga oryziterrae]MVT42167.1 glucose-1-phosphate cytidylyltransferase [Chitinophaga oryziterrae]
MKVVIFAGGLGTRISEETDVRPKPMVEIGGKPILWHIMKMYSHYGFNDFIICLGYKGYVIKEYFMHYFLHNSDLTIELNSNKLDIHYTKTESFKVTLVDTGLPTKTAGRLKRIKQYIGDEDFMLTYGDGVADINLEDLLKFHKSHNKMATVTAVQPEARFGGIEMDENGKILAFKEKPKGDNKFINGGFFVLKPQIFDYLKDDMDNIMWEDDPMENLVADAELIAYKHTGFWKCMDALRDKIELESLWQTNNAKWKVW